MLNFIKKIFNRNPFRPRRGKVVVVLDPNDININLYDKNKTYEKYVSISNIIEELDFCMQHTKAGEVILDRYIPENIWLTNKDVKYIDDKYMWILNKEHFTKRFMEIVWEKAFNYFSVWPDNFEVSVKLKLIYSNGEESTLSIESKKGDHNLLIHHGIKHTYDWINEK